jgi:signal transduction histidine kinase
MSGPVRTEASHQSAAALLRLRRTTIVLFFCFLALITMAGILHLAEQYRSAVNDAMRSVRSSARNAESYTARTLAETYRVLEGIGDVYAQQIRLGRFDEGELHELMNVKLQRLPHVAALAVLDANRMLKAAGRVFPVKPDSMSRMGGSLAVAPTDIGGGLFMGQAYRSEEHVTPGSAPVLYLPIGARIVEEGRTLGYAVAVIRPDFFSRFFDTIDVGPRGAVELWRADGTLLAATAALQDSIGKTYPEAARRFQAGDAASEGAQQLVYAVAEGYSRRIQATSRIPDMPLAVLATVNAEDYLSAWRDSRNRIGVGIVLLVLAMAGTGFFIFAQLKRSELNEMELRQAKAAAEEANDAKSRFLAHMSHEFRTPLNAIMGFSEIIKNKVLGEGVSPVYVSYADHIHKSGEHLLNIVNDILDMAKIESGIQPMHPEKVNVLKVTESAVAFVDRLASERGLRIAVNVPVNLPQVIADERYLRQVLINLLTNAVKFSAPGLEIVIEARRHAKGLDISVRDHGPGIDEAIMRRIGEPFLQGNPTVTRAGQGAGLGLSICKQYMDLLGGELLIDSRANAGTTASVRFPPALLADPPVRIASAAE